MDNGSEDPVAVAGDPIEPGVSDLQDQAVAPELGDEAAHSLGPAAGFLRRCGRLGVEACGEIGVANPLMACSPAITA